jgi:hypothetical protein
MRLIGVLMAMLAFVPAATAAPDRAMFSVTLGSADGTPDSSICVAGIDCTYVPSVGGLAASLVVPFSGTVTSFSVNSGSSGGTVALRVLRGASATFLGVRSSAHVPLAPGLNTFRVRVPVEAGDVLALDNNSSALLFEDGGDDPLDVTSYFQPALAGGQTDQPNHVVTDKRLLLSATVESTPPAIRVFRQSAAVWRESAHVRKRVPVGTRFTFQLNEPATGSVLFTRAGRGVGQVAITGRAGRNTLRFNGQLASGRLLKPGRYAARVSVENDAGDTATSRPLSFRIVG